MPIIYKLVGIQSGTDVKTEMKHPEWDDAKTALTIKDVKSLFIKLGCPEEMNDVKFITDSETMRDEKEYSVSSDSNRVIFVFTMEVNLKKNIQDIFNQHGYVVKKEKQKVQVKPQEDKMDVELVKPIPEDEIKIDPESIERSNQETIRLFSEKNFQTLLRIFIEDKDIFKRFASYISSGNVVMESLNSQKHESFNYTKQLEEIQKLDIGVNETQIKNALNKFNGHINLTLRFLLTTKSLLE